MPRVIDLVRCTVGSGGLNFTQLMRCLGTNSASTVRRLLDEAIEVGLVKPVNVGKYGRRLAYRPTLRGVVYTAVQDVFFGCQGLASIAVREAVKASGDGVLRLVDSVLNGGVEGLNEADNTTTEAIYNLFNRLRSIIIERYASMLASE